MPADSTRRSFLKLASAGVGFAAIPARPLHFASAPAAKATVESPAHLMRDLALYIAQSGGVRLPDKVVEKAKHHILDTLAAIISGADFKVGRLSDQNNGCCRSWTRHETQSIKGQTLRPAV